MATRLTDAEYIRLLEKENKYLRNKIQKMEEKQAEKLEKDFKNAQKRFGDILSAILEKL